jgi:hypothetical protein
MVGGFVRRLWKPVSSANGVGAAIREALSVPPLVERHARFHHKQPSHLDSAGACDTRTNWHKGHRDLGARL